MVSLTLAITWPQGALSQEEDLTAAAQVHGGVREALDNKPAQQPREAFCSG
jgi:hypothetical protein